MRALLSYFLITLTGKDLENISLIKISNVRGEIAFPYSNAIILKTKNFFLRFLFLFLNIHYILNILIKNIIVIPNVFPKLNTVKVLVRLLLKKCSFRTSFESQHVKVSQTLVKSAWQHIYHIYFFITVGRNDLENISLILIWNLRGPS